MGEPTYTLPPLPTGAKLKPNSASLLFHVRGHASTRWRGSKDTQTSINLNQALSQRRAASVRAAIELMLKKQLGSAPFSVTSKGDGIWAAPDGIFQPDDNEPITRSVSVTSYLTTKSSQIQTVKQPPKRIQARTRQWYLSINELHLTAVVYAQASGRLFIRNAVSGKKQLYTFSLHGGGAIIDPIGWYKRIFSGTTITPAKNIVGEEVHFETNVDMGFGDFDGERIEIGTETASVYVGAQRWELSFKSLGPRAQNLQFNSAIKVGLPSTGGGKLGMPHPSAGVASVVGALHISTPREDDDLEIPIKDVDMVAVNAKDWGGGVVATFPTGKSDYHDIPSNERQRLEDFVRHWASIYEMATR